MKPHVLPQVVALLLTAGLQAWAEPSIAPNQVSDAAGLLASQLANILIVEQTDTHSSLRMQVGDETTTLVLSPYSLRSEDFEVLVQDANGALRAMDSPPPARTVRGTVKEWAGSIVTGSLVDGRFTGSIRTPDRGVWFLQPAADFGANGQPGIHVFHRAEDVAPHPYRCGFDRAAKRQQVIRIENPPQSSSFGTTVATEISVDSDVEFFVANGSSVAATVDDIESVMVGVDNIFRSQVAISYVLNRIIVRTTEPDPYTSTDSDDLLDEFQDVWEDDFDGQERDIAHLMTGKNIDGPIIGLAFVGKVCDREGLFTNGGYGLSQSRFSGNFALRVALTAHEVGHNWNADHCAEIDSGGNCPASFPADCGIMCACLGGCNGSLTQFGATSRSDIIAHRNSRGCLNFSTIITYVNRAFVGPENGSLSNPYNTFREGIWATDAGGRVIFFGGNTYDADRTTQIVDRPVTLESLPGTGVAIIGQ